MDRTCSIAEARNDLSGVVREAESGTPVVLSRRGKPVAVIVSAVEFARLSARKPGLASTIDAFRREHAASLDDAEWLPARPVDTGRKAWRP